MHAFILRFTTMSVTTAATIVQADHHKLMLCACPLGRAGEVLEPDRPHGLIGQLIGKTTLTRGNQTLSASQISNFLEFAQGGTNAFTLTLPDNVDLCNRYNLKNGSYIEVIVKNGHGNGSGDITIAPGAGMTVWGDDTVDEDRTRKVGIYIKDHTSSVALEGADVYVIFA